ncbi:ABC transporter ATP-binding protein [Micromonospora sp. DT68]|uniref:ABC transporter ATP-binding protein n=1 Tax=Micromonospora sp. DT68 TaxID=3416522 RepID=UPI003CEE3716
MQAVLPVTIAWLTKAVVDGVGGRDAGLAAGATAGLVVAGLMMGVASHLQSFLDKLGGYRSSLYAQDVLHQAVNRFSGLARFESPELQDRLRYAQATAGQTASRAVSGILAIAGGVLTTTALLYSVGVISPVTAAFLALSAAPAAAAEFMLARRRAALLWDLGPLERREIFFAGLITSIGAAKEVRLYGIGDYLKSRVRRERLQINALHGTQDRRELLTLTGLGVLGAVGTGGGFAWIVMSAINGVATIGDVALYIAAVGAAQAAVIALSGSLARTYEDLLTFEHFQSVVTAEPDLPHAVQPRSVTTLREGIELRDVWFRYSPSHPWILRGVNLWIPAGASVALVGRNGTGKSTLVKLLCRFYDPSRGQILWDGVDLRELDLAALRGAISAVFQDAMHYDLTARENIGLGDIDQMDDLSAIRGAARLSGMDDAISALPRGYDTLLTRLFKSAAEADDAATGVILSGGQWQRLALARAFLRGRRHLLILDEPSTGLDAVSEADIQERVRGVWQGVATVVISHRLSTAKAADVVAVLDEGQIAEAGTHADLMARSGIYAGMFELQARGYQETDAVVG